LDSNHALGETFSPQLDPSNTEQIASGTASENKATSALKQSRQRRSDRISPKHLLSMTKCQFSWVPTDRDRLVRYPWVKYHRKLQPHPKSTSRPPPLAL